MDCRLLPRMSCVFLAIVLSFLASGWIYLGDGPIARALGQCIGVVMYATCAFLLVTALADRSKHAWAGLVFGATTAVGGALFWLLWEWRGITFAAAAPGTGLLLGSAALSLGILGAMWWPAQRPGYLLLGGMAVMIIAGMAVLVLVPSPTAITRAFIRAVARGDSSRAAALSTVDLRWQLEKAYGAEEINWAQEAPQADRASITNLVVAEDMITVELTVPRAGVGPEASFFTRYYILLARRPEGWRVAGRERGRVRVLRQGHDQHHQHSKDS